MKRWLVLGGLCLLLMYLVLEPFIDVLVFSVFIYYATRPIYLRVNKHIKSKTLAASLSMFLMVLPVIIFFIYVVAVAASHFSALEEITDSGYMETGTEMISGYIEAASALSLDNIMAFISENASLQTLMGDALGVLGSAFDVFYRLFIILLITYVLLRHGEAFSLWFREKIVQGERELTESFLKGIDEDLEKVFFGGVLTAIIVAAIGIAVYNGLNILNPVFKIPYPEILGILCGLASLIPGIGVFMVWFSAALLLGIQAYLSGVLVEQLWFIGLFLITSFILVDLIPGWVLRAKISGRGVNETLMLLAFLLGPVAFGIAGIFIAPMILVVTYNFMKTVLPKLKVL